MRLSLDRIEEVEIGRGPQRHLVHDGPKVRLDLEDRAASQVHARLLHTAEGWLLEDARSKNGTRLNGVVVGRAVVSGGDVIECGSTFLVVRSAPGPISTRNEPGGLADFATLSPALERELELLPKIARARIPVLIRGESGTGKEGVATAIHRLSGRPGLHVAVNCGAIPENLIESELFGSHRGAFSGAADRPGLVRNAQGGTLFLDEVAELPVAAQAALLRFLQEGEVMPLGAGKAVAVDVRVVAATNRAIEPLVASGEFRADLHARLRGFEVRLPPLRSRLEDLGLLIATIVARHDAGGGPRRLSRAAARALFMHSWPYNVRELEQALQAALVTIPGEEIDVEHLALAAPSGPPKERADAKVRLLALLEQHSGNISAVAREMATSRSQVQRLIARYSITRDGSTEPRISGAGPKDS
jgi:transcriptional regulator with PAS, ATPase and Fis domain